MVLNNNDIGHFHDTFYVVDIGQYLPTLKKFYQTGFVLNEDSDSLHYLLVGCEIYFASMDLSDPRTNGKTYIVYPTYNSLRSLRYENHNTYNNKDYYISIVIENCEIDSLKYIAIRNILKHYYYIPNVLICNNYELFLDLPNVTFYKYSDKDMLHNQSRITINDADLYDTFVIDHIRNQLFDSKYYDDYYKIIKGSNPLITIYILTIGNDQFKYALESVLSQNIDCIIIINKNLDVQTCYDEMNNRCNTKYYIEVDEDTIFFDNQCVSKMYCKMMEQPANVWECYYTLVDENFGVDKDYILVGMKIYNADIQKTLGITYKTDYEYAIDRTFNDKINQLGFVNVPVGESIGYHQKNYSPFDVFIKCAKMGHELINPVMKLNGVMYSQKFEFGTMMRYFTKYRFVDLLFIITNVVMTLSESDGINIFLEQFRKIKQCIIQYDLYHINERRINNFYLIQKISKTDIDTILESHTCIIEKNVDYYCIVGFIYPLLYPYAHNWKTYPYELFMNKIQ